MNKPTYHTGPLKLDTELPIKAYVNNVMTPKEKETLQKVTKELTQSATLDVFRQLTSLSGIEIDPTLTPYQQIRKFERKGYRVRIEPRNESNIVRKEFVSYIWARIMKRKKLILSRVYRNIPYSQTQEDGTITMGYELKFWDFNFKECPDDLFVEDYTQEEMVYLNKKVEEKERELAEEYLRDMKNSLSKLNPNMTKL